MTTSGLNLKRYSDIKSIMSLYKLANLLCLAPRFDFHKMQCDTSKIYNYYVVLMMAITIGLSAWSFLGRWYCYVSVMTLSTLGLDLILYVSVTITNCVAIIKLSFWKNADMKKFLGHLLHYDQQSSIPIHLTSKEKRGLYMAMVGYHSFIFTFFAYDCYVWISAMGILQCQYYIFRFFQCYHLMTLGALIHNYVIIIRDRFAHINEKLSSFVRASQKVFMVPEVVWPKIRICKDNLVVQVIRLYTSVCDMVQLFNRIFGILFMLLITNLTLGLLQPLNLAIVYWRSKFNGVNLGRDLTALCIIWAAIYLVCGFLLATSCDQAVKEAKRTSYLSYKLTQDLSVCKLKVELRDDLILLGQQASLHAPQFSACGFFTIDYTLLLSILGSVTTYLIVLIQLNQ